MRELCLSLDNFWFSSHLLDLLHWGGSLGQGEGGLGAGLREFLLLDYATALCSHHSLWQVGMAGCIMQLLLTLESLQSLQLLK